MSNQPLDDQVIMEQISRGDLSAMEALYDCYSRAVYSMILRIVQDQQVAEELTQETFFRAWKQAKSFSNDRGKCASWLMSIAHNIAIDEIRRRRARPKSIRSEDSSKYLMNLPDSSLEDPDEIIMGGVRRSIVLEALRELPENQRKVLEMSYFGGLTQSEIADKVGEPLGTIKTRMRLALQHLRRNLIEKGIKPEQL